MTEYQKVCYEIANERPHICTGCKGTQYLSHSHLIPKSYRKDLYAVKENITLHCMDVNKKGCHSRYEGMGAALLDDFLDNMKAIYTLDQTYFWKKIFKLKNYWESKCFSATPADSEIVIARARIKIAIELNTIPTEATPFWKR